MKKFYKYLLVLIVPLSLVFFSYPSGSPGGKTGSPGDEGASCHDCHSSFDIIPQTDWITTNIPVTGYMPGDTYEITATGTFEGVVNFGYELTAEDNTGHKKGTFTLIDDVRNKLTNNNTAVTHTINGITPTDDSNSWTVNWTAPTEGVGEITFYAAFNAGNGAGGTTGDQIFTTAHSVIESTVGIGDDLLANQINAYPNPATNYVNIDAPRDAQIRIVDVLGHQVFAKENTSHSERIDLSELDQGIYFLQVLHENNAATMRIVKN